MGNVSRSPFYEYKRAFQNHGFSGLIDKPPIPGPHPNELSMQVKDKILALSLKHPAFGHPARPGAIGSAESLRS